jgi:hypothetical protein
VVYDYGISHRRSSDRRRSGLTAAAATEFTAIAADITGG